MRVPPLFPNVVEGVSRGFAAPNTLGFRAEEGVGGIGVVCAHDAGGVDAAAVHRGEREAVEERDAGREELGSLGEG